MTTYWLLGEKSTTKSETSYYNKIEYSEVQNNVINNPSITFQGPDSPATTHNVSPERITGNNHNNKPIEILSERERIKHEIATFVAKDLINNIDSAVREFRKSQSANFSSNTSSPRNSSLCNGNQRGRITPTYDKELVISKGKVRDVVNRFNSCVLNSSTVNGNCSKKMLTKSKETIKTED